MPHVLTVKIDDYNGLYPVLECTEPTTSPCQSAGDGCSVVTVFEWDSAASMEGYVGQAFDACKVTVDVLAANEDEFQWQLAGRTPSDNRTGGA